MIASGDKTVLVINPNSSERCTEGIRVAAQAAAGKGIETVTVRMPAAPEYIVTPEDEAKAAELVTSYVEAALQDPGRRFRAVIVACYSDPGLEAVRALLPAPALGVRESTFILAQGLGWPYGVLTSEQEEEGEVREAAARCGLAAGLITVQGAGCSIAALDEQRPEAVAALRVAARRAVAEGARSLCLGCAAMAGLEGEIREEVGVPVFECVASAVQLASVYLHMAP